TSSAFTTASSRGSSQSRGRLRSRYPRPSHELRQAILLILSISFFYGGRLFMLSRRALLQACLGFRGDRGPIPQTRTGNSPMAASAIHREIILARFARVVL